ncbi:hypothetical protein L596_007762 [Steinernema carpocapsae]|uniref:Uncharacterized protein n=1 Tax=Steinernema carpocapsae TaxID=34508 RepID=A0A4U5PAX6_STECR|nr:hypothetical protein L596_007762 [Steinernema carpocapsae]
MLVNRRKIGGKSLPRSFGAVVPVGAVVFRRNFESMLFLAHGRPFCQSSDSISEDTFGRSLVSPSAYMNYFKANTSYLLLW